MTRLLAILPHPDDFEFNLGGTFASFRRRFGAAVQLKIVTTSRGASGHHELDDDATFARRQAEAAASAALIGAEHECLRQLDGSHVPGQVMVDRNLLGGLWNAVRAFRADILFTLPLAADPLAGVHSDHEETARAVRLVAYQLGVPRAYPSLGTPADFGYRSPLILLADDTYAAGASYDLAHDISADYETKLAMAQCHVSQVQEWLPFLDGQPPLTPAQYAERFRLRHERVNARYGFADAVPREFFRISRWGRAPREGELERLFG